MIDLFQPILRFDYARKSKYEKYDELHGGRVVRACSGGVAHDESVSVENERGVNFLKRSY